MLTIIIITRNYSNQVNNKSRVKLLY